MPQVTLNPSKDVHLTSSIATTNQNDIGFIDVGEEFSATTIRRLLIQFDLTSLPAGAIITGATLNLYDTGTDLTNNTRIMSAYRLKRLWGETTATWNTYDGSNSWQTAGALGANDAETTDIGGVSMPNPPSAGYASIVLTASAIQDWIDGDFTNNGLLVYMAVESDDLHRFESRNETNKPQLVLDYTAPSAFLVFM